MATDWLIVADERTGGVMAGKTATAEFGDRPLNRREVLYKGGLGAVGMLWSNWLSASTLPLVESRQRAKSVIMIFNCGAPSHLDLFDMKPHARFRRSSHCRAVIVEDALMQGYSYQLVTVAPRLHFRDQGHMRFKDIWVRDFSKQIT